MAVSLLALPSPASAHQTVSIDHDILIIKGDERNDLVTIDYDSIKDEYIIGHDIEDPIPAGCYRDSVEPFHKLHCPRSLVHGIFIETVDGSDSVVFGFDTTGFPGPILVQVSTGAGNDKFVGGPEDDDVDMGDGNNNVDTSGGNDQVATGDGNDKVDTGPGDDKAFAGGGTDKVTTADGNDLANLGPGNDTGKGGPGNDTLKGAKGGDHLFGGAGVDWLIGGLGGDFLFGGGDNDKCKGGPGSEHEFGCEIGFNY